MSKFSKDTDRLKFYVHQYLERLFICIKQATFMTQYLM